MLSYFVGTFIFSLITLISLFHIRKTENLFLKKNLVIYSGKSSSGALLLGGLPVGLSVVFGVVAMKFFDTKIALNFQMTLSFLISSGLILSYGYLDDRFEIRPIVKLFFQISAVFIFTTISAVDIGGIFSSILFIFYSFYGLSVLNGTNLLDGLDLMSVKLSTVAYLAFFSIAYMFNSQATMIYSLICLGALLPFAVYNKFPSKMHLGEIGGAYLGFSYLLISISLFRDLQQTHSFIDAFSLSVLPMSLSVVEVGISFLRRIFNSKSPFKGDKFHIHQILRNYYQFSVRKTTNILSMAYTLTFTLSLASIAFLDFKPMVAYPLTLVALCIFQFKIGKKYWIKKSFNFNLESFLTSLRKDHLLVIDNSKVDKFEFKIIDTQEKKSKNNQKDKTKKAA